MNCKLNCILELLIPNNQFSNFAGLGELVQSRRHLQPLLEDPPLPLNTNNLWPSYKSVHILLRRQCSTYSKLLRPLLKQRIHYLLLQSKKNNHTETNTAQINESLIKTRGDNKPRYSM
ncbi:hypothetical protein Hanom_Chr02g00123341 [Helianthus anomalus]